LHDDVIFLCDTFDSSVPKEGPASIRGYPLNSTAIHISWKSIPSSSHKEQLLGYRIKYRRLGSLLYSEVNVTSNITEAVVNRLAPQIGYEIKVNGFNEIGHGPPGEDLVVKTLQSGKRHVYEFFPIFIANISGILLLFLWLRNVIWPKLYSVVKKNDNNVKVQ